MTGIGFELTQNLIIGCDDEKPLKKLLEIYYRKPLIFCRKKELARLQKAKQRQNMNEQQKKRSRKNLVYAKETKLENPENLKQQRANKNRCRERQKRMFEEAEESSGYETE